MNGSSIIGLLGGVASGKSTVARLLAERGAVVLDADRAAHHALADRDVQAALRERWGAGVFDSAGELRRGEIARRIFGPGAEHTADRKFLEALIHPRVRTVLMADLERHRAAGTPAMVLDIPLLLEAGWAAECDVLLLVDSPEPLRRARAAERGWTADEFAWREAAQTPINQKRECADAVVVNNGSVEDLKRAVDNFWANSAAQL